MSITAEELGRVLAYDPSTGVFTWLVTLSSKGPRGATAGSQRKDGYVSIRIRGQLYYAHRLAWLFVHGEWPAHEIDHIDGNPGNNRVANLRSATRTLNLANTRRRRNNSSGVKGVSWDKQNRKWVAQLRFRRSAQYIGRFNRLEDAAAAYKSAAHKYFGEFARPE